MRRREFIGFIGGAATAWPLEARARQAGKLPTIGFLGAAMASVWSPWTAAFLLRLRELGWIEGRTIAVEYRWAEGREAPHYLIRDRDRIYGAAVTRRLRAMGIRDKPIAAGSPWQNGFAERLIGSIRRECTDHVVAWGEEHLRRVLRSYAHYYNEQRTHRSLNKDAPSRRAIERLGTIISKPILGGLHQRYCRI